MLTSYRHREEVAGLLLLDLDDPKFFDELNHMAIVDKDILVNWLRRLEQKQNDTYKTECSKCSWFVADEQKCSLSGKNKTINDSCTLIMKG